MSWHFSQAMAAASSEASCSGGAPSAPSNTTTTPDASSCLDKTTDASMPSPSGMTCEHSTESLGLASWMSSLAASRARTSARPEAEQASTAHAPACGEKWPESFARWDRDSSSWKTPQCSLLAGLDEFSETWPRWGMMLRGECSELSMPAHLTSETESGLWPTPNCPNGGRSVAHVTDWRGRTAYHNGKKVQVGLESAVRMWPTPLASDGAKGGPNQRGSKGDLRLSSAVRLFPTPTCQDAKNNGAPSQMERNTKPLNAEIGGPLNPTWVEWLMGWPLGWTDCAASATDRFRQWLRSHSRLSRNAS